MSMFEKFTDLNSATTAIVFNRAGDTKVISPEKNANKTDVVLYFWDTPVTDPGKKDGKKPTEMVILLLTTEGCKPTAKQISAVEKWLKRNFFNQKFLANRTWKSGSNGFASAALDDGSGLFVKMIKKSEVSAKKLKEACAAVVDWLLNPDAKKSDTGDNSGKPNGNTGNSGKPNGNTGNSGKPNGNTGNSGKSSWKYSDFDSPEESLRKCLRSIGYYQE